MFYILSYLVYLVKSDMKRVCRDDMPSFFIIRSVSCLKFWDYYNLFIITD